MFVEEKVRNYLKGRKIPVTKEKIAKHFMVSTSSVNKSLMSLAAKGVILIVESKPRRYKYNHRADATTNGAGAYHISEG